ncbi:MAG: hypothetical protein DRG39_05630 [Deltaproteobacteria bacterium]|nr:MAG: hypothetical protein DRG39_05630 [Deltaproteobacteria bacterium]
MKVLICGYNFHGYLDSIARGFMKNGCSVEVFAHPNISIRKLRSSNPAKRIYTWYRLRKINNSLKGVLLKKMPDMVLCINASSLLPDTVGFLCKNFISILWLVDALDRVATDLNTIKAFKKVFVFEPTDRARIEGAEFLPYGFDEEIYYKQEVDKIYDVSFVGAGHKERYEPLNRLSEICEAMGFNLFVFGPFTLFKKDPSYKEKYPFLYRSLSYNGRLSPMEINRIYNRSWININLHHPQSKEGVNPRTFEIAGSGNFQLIDRKEALKRLFGKDEIVMYSNIEELADKISHFLKKKGSLFSMAERARKRALSQHTFSHRARHILTQVWHQKAIFHQFLAPTIP